MLGHIGGWGKRKKSVILIPSLFNILEFWCFVSHRFFFLFCIHLDASNCSALGQSPVWRRCCSSWVNGGQLCIFTSCSVGRPPPPQIGENILPKMPALLLWRNTALLAHTGRIYANGHFVWYCIHLSPQRLVISSNSIEYKQAHTHSTPVSSSDHPSTSMRKKQAWVIVLTLEMSHW